MVTGGYKVDDVNVDVGCVCTLVPKGRIIGRVWKFGCAWQARCYLDHGACARSIGAQQLRDNRIKDPQRVLSAWLLRGIECTTKEGHAEEPLKLYSEE